MVEIDHITPKAQVEEKRLETNVCSIDIAMMIGTLGVPRVCIRQELILALAPYTIRFVLRIETLSYKMVLVKIKRIFRVYF
jgi:hypothetical protein